MEYFRTMLFVLFLSAAGCASMPDVTVGYYLSKVDLELKVIQTALCSPAGEPVLASDILISPKYTRDPKAYHKLNLKALDGTFTNNTAVIEFYDDGRIKSLNSTQTGQGGEVVKAALALVSGRVLTMDAKADQCTALERLAGKNNPLTITYYLLVDFSEGATTPQTMQRTSLSDSQFETVASIFGDAVTAAFSLTDTRGVCETRGPDGGIPHCGAVPVPDAVTAIVLRQPAVAAFEVEAGPVQQKIAFEFDVHVPQRGRLYSLPIQRPPAFGVNSFELVLSEGGVVTKLKYGKDSGAAPLLTAASDVRTALAADTAAEKAAAITAEADLIAAQQRLLRCKADPVICL